MLQDRKTQKLVDNLTIDEQQDHVIALEIMNQI